MKYIKLLYPTMLIFTLLIGVLIGFYIDLPREMTITMEYGESVTQVMEQVDLLSERWNNRTFILSENNESPKPMEIEQKPSVIKVLH